MSSSSTVNDDLSHTEVVRQGVSLSANGISEEQTDIYKSLSKNSILSFILGLMGFSAFTIAQLIILPLIAVALGFLGWRAIKKYPTEFSGKPFAVLGIVLSSFTLIAAPMYHIYVYATEVPDGFTRVNFYELTAAKGQPDVPTMASLKWDGQPVFIKGYVHPNSMTSTVSDKFVIVPDLGTCCFGGQPPLTHMIEVQLNGEQYAHRNFRKKSLAGVFSVNRSLKPIDGLTGVYYHIQADLLK